MKVYVIERTTDSTGQTKACLGLGVWANRAAACMVASEKETSVADEDITYSVRECEVK